MNLSYVICCFCRLEFVEYWQKITSIDKVTEFQKHHCSEELKSFLEVNENMKNTVSVCVLSTLKMLMPPFFVASSGSGRIAKRE